MIQRRKISPSTQQRLTYIGMMLREIRMTEGKRQNDYTNIGLTRRQVQTGEYGNNMTLVKLISILDGLGFSLKDIDWND